MVSHKFSFVVNKLEAIPISTMLTLVKYHTLDLSYSLNSIIKIMEELFKPRSQNAKEEVATRHLARKTVLRDAQ